MNHRASGTDKDPFADFTDWQWYSQQSRQSVYYAAFSPERLDRPRLVQLAREIIAHAPQLIAHIPGADAANLDNAFLEKIVLVKEVPDLESYPDPWDVSGSDLFDALDRPMIRLSAAVRTDGPDAAGRQSSLVVVSSHALLEGVDSADLSRSRKVARTNPDTRAKPASLRNRLLAGLLVPLQLAAAALLAPHHKPREFATLALDRTKLKRAAARIGIRQRSLMFALVCFALNRDGALSRRKLSVLYTDLDAKRAEGEFFRFRVVESEFAVNNDFIAFARGVDGRLSEDEKAGTASSHDFVGAMVTQHRRLKRLMPFLYSKDTFRFAGFYHIDLSLVPPHRLGGALSADLMEPVYCGTHHPGLNTCIFAPGEKWITFNCNMHRRHLPRLDDIPTLLATLDAEPDDRGHGQTQPDMRQPEPIGA